MEGAIEFFKQAIRNNPDYADAHNNLGSAYGILRKYKMAIKSFEQITEAIKSEQENTETIFDCSLEGSKPHRSVYFRFKELMDSFSFMLVESLDSEKENSLQVHGHIGYQNFSLSVAVGENWSCGTSEGGFRRTTSKAKKLSGFMMEHLIYMNNCNITCECDLPSENLNFVLIR